MEIMEYIWKITWIIMIIIGIIYFFYVIGSELQKLKDRVDTLESKINKN